MLKKFVSILMSAVVAFSAAFAAAFSCLSVNVKALDQNAARQGVVAVVFYLKNASLKLVDPATSTILDSAELGAEFWFGSGSGFFVGKTGEAPQYIVTNHHVVKSYIDAGEGGEYASYAGMYNGLEVYYYASSCEMRIYYDENDYDVAYIDCYGDQEKVDLAVLRLRNPTDKRTALPIGSVSEDNIGDTVYTVGYPGNADNDYTSASKYGLNDSSIHKGSIVRIVMDDKGVERISIDATIQHGNSGGPLVNENGMVIGVNTNVRSRSPYDGQVEADYYSLSAATLTDFLNKNSIPYEQASGSAGLLICVIVGIVVVAAIVVAVVVIMKKKKAAPANAAAAQPAAAVPVQAVPTPAPAPACQIIGVAGLHSGKAYAVKNVITIGRNNSQCEISFPVNTQGISGVHCQIMKQGNGYAIVDKGSSYGTFLGNGQKLQPEAPTNIGSGEYFYLGSRDQLFQIKY